MKCRFCEEESSLIRAHIIPEAFFRRLRDEDGLSLITEGERPKRAPIGAYDKEILCAECEKGFGKVDSYAASFLIDPPKGAQPIMLYETVIGYEIQEYRYDLLKLFFLSVMWRASVSKLAVFSQVSLGPYEEKVKQMLKSQDPGSKDEFPISIWKFRGTHAEVIAGPAAAKIDGITYYCFYMGGYVAYIKVSSKQDIQWPQELTMSPDKVLLIPERDFHKSAEAQQFYSQLAALRKWRNGT